MEMTLAQKAIDLALNGDWKEAIKINLQILADNKEDVDTLNRLARAHSEIGDIGKARNYAKKVIEIDPVNSIATKCLEKWKDVKNSSVSHSGAAIDVDAFLEEPGKTKHVTLVNIGDEKIFATLDPGEEVKISPHNHSVSVHNSGGKYIGRLPDDISARLRNMLKAGNKYQVLIKSISPKEITIFIRELERGKGGTGVASFPPEKIDYVTFTPPELIHKDTPDIGDDSGDSSQE